MSELLTAVAIVFIVGGAFALVANRFGLPSVPFLILAGILVGLEIDETITLELAQYGIILLVFTFGSRVELDTVRPLLRESESIAFGQVLVLGLLGYMAGILLTLEPIHAVYVGIAAALSSTTVATALIEPSIRNNLVHGRMAESIQFIQDLLAILFILILGVEVFDPGPIAANLVVGGAILALGVFVNKYLFSVLETLAGDSDELLLVGIIAMLVGFVYVAGGLGISLVVGAFAAGLAVRHDPVEHLDLFNGLTSLTDFFAAIFFVTLGALVTLPTAEVILIIVALTILTVVVKPVLTILLMLEAGYEPRSATLTGFSIDQVSEFALIIAIEAVILGVLAPMVFEAIILVAALTMITSSITHGLDERLYRGLAARNLWRSRHEQIDSRSSVPDEISAHVIVIGFGQQGRHLTAMCKTIDRPVIVIENDPGMLDRLDQECPAYVFGDAMDSYTLEKANVAEAELIVSTAHSNRLNRHLLTLDLEADVILRAESASAALDLMERGADYVTVPDLLAGEQLVEHLSAIADGAITPEELRAHHVEQLEDQARLGYHTSADEIKALR